MINSLPGKCEICNQYIRKGIKAFLAGNYDKTIELFIVALEKSLTFPLPKNITSVKKNDDAGRCTPGDGRV